jgi:signal transduction histidine kinase
MSLNNSVAALVSKLAIPGERANFARDLAAYLGAEDLIVFIKDPEIGVLLPAPGFRQTLPVGRAWKAFLEECVRSGSHVGQLPFPDRDRLQPAAGAVADDGSVLILLGGAPDLDAVAEVCTLLPLLAAAFQGERATITAEGHVRMAQQAAAQARALAKALDVARQELEAALHGRDQFLSIAAHELKTPLTSLLGYLQVFKRRAAREAYINERDQATLATIELQGRRLQRMVGDLFDLSRIETQGLSVERKPLDLSLMCKRLLDELRPILEKHTIELRTEGALVVEGDYVRLEQVLQNLLDNAIKYSPEGGAIIVEVASQGEQACLSVRDQGIGIPEDSTAHLFERFYRATNVNARNISGLGIGLFLVHEIVSAHGGTVEVSSQVGQGTNFTVCLPLSNDDLDSSPRLLHFAATTDQREHTNDEKDHAARSASR